MAPASKPHAPLEDPLAYLPCSRIAEYRKNQVIYNPNEAATSIYLILEGRVKVSRLTDNGRLVLVNIYQTDEFFGESAFLHLHRYSDEATALENTNLMSWIVSEVEEVIMRRPRLGVALVQMMAQRTTEFSRRILSFSSDNVACRLARCLISLSERMGTPAENGSVSLVPFTHELLSEHIGTTREAVSHYMMQHYCPANEAFDA
jgi:CRP/FNR family transcriptional regulator, cyclic AMP receptor protein